MPNPKQVGKTKRYLEPGCFDDLISLSYLHMDHNEIAYLPMGIFRPITGLYDLQLQNNLLKDWKLGYFRESSRVRKLNLNNNMIEKLPDYGFVGLEGLVTLEIRNNSLTEFSPAFNRKFHLSGVPWFMNILELKRCTRLYLNDNNIESLEAVYDKNTILCEIDLSNNAIDRVHPEFTTNLKVRINPRSGGLW